VSLNHSPKSITATSISLVADGPHDGQLVTKAGALRYELRKIRQAKKVATYELTIFDNDDILNKHIFKGTYSDAVVWAIQEFIKVVE